eukprot:754954-Hanusia_phi.AAC.3
MSSKDQMATASEQHEEAIKRLQTKIDQLMAYVYSIDLLCLEQQQQQQQLPAHSHSCMYQELQAMLKFNSTYETKKNSLFSEVEEIMSQPRAGKQLLATAPPSASHADLQLRIDELESLRQADMEYIAELEEKVIAQKKKILQLEALLLQPKTPEQTTGMG